MVVRVTVTSDIHDESLWNEGHLISNWSKKMALNLTLSTKAEAPVNKRKNKRDGTARGHLRDSIDSRRSRSKVKEIRINVASRASYSEYVIFGTAVVTSSRGMNLPGNYVGHGQNSATAKWQGKSFVSSAAAVEAGLIDELPKRVSGQPPNDFLTRGFDRASIRNPSLRG